MKDQQTRRSLTESEFCCSDSHASWTHVVTSRLEKYFECSCAGMHKGALSRRFAGVGCDHHQDGAQFSNQGGRGDAG
jgi:hypothetical protein